MRSGYLYKTTNILNNKWYLGSSRKFKTMKEAKLDPYLGSGKIFKQALKKYGKENFKKEILCTTEDAYELEELILEVLDAANDPMSYNIKNKGIGATSESILGSNNPLSKENSNSKLIREKFSKIFSGENNPSKKYKKDHGHGWNKGKVSGENNPMYGTISPNKGVIPSEYTRNLLSKGSIDRIAINHKNFSKSKKVKSFELQKFLDEGWELGEKTIPCQNCGRNLTGGNYSRHLKKCKNLK